MKIAFAPENRPTLLMGALLIVLGSCSYTFNQLQHTDARQHSDARWNDLSARLNKVESACRLKEGP